MGLYVTELLTFVQTSIVQPIKILIADDEPDILEFIKYNLEKESYQVFTASNGNKAIEIAKKEIPNVIVLDVMMPVKNGFETCEILRTLPYLDNTLIIFLTAMADDDFQIKGLEVGADDYITKPISPKVLVSKINALLRRTKAEPIATANEIVINKDNFTVTIKGEKINLPKKEFELLALLNSMPSKVFLRQDILSQVWGSEVIVGDRTIDVHVRKIRAKLGIDCIKTIKGVGYKFELD